MIFSRHRDQYHAGESRNFAPDAASHGKFLFDTNEAYQILDVAVTHSKQMTAPFSIRYKWKLHSAPHRHEKIASSLTFAVRIRRA
jgi:hypothetical protein